jgi:hypothetical protein
MTTPELLICTVKDCLNPRLSQKPDATNRHCAHHQLQAKLKNNRDRLEQVHGKGYNKGVEDFRMCATREFARLGDGQLTGSYVASLIWQMPGPAGEYTENGNSAKSEEVKA